MNAVLHWLNARLRPACGAAGCGTVVARKVSCKACKATPSYLAVAGSLSA